MAHSVSSERHRQCGGKRNCPSSKAVLQGSKRDLPTMYKLRYCDSLKPCTEHMKQKTVTILQRLSCKSPYPLAGKSSRGAGCDVSSRLVGRCSDPQRPPESDNHRWEGEISWLLDTYVTNSRRENMQLPKLATDDCNERNKQAQNNGPFGW